MTQLKEFKAPTKHENWRFSGLKSFELAGLPDAEEANSFKASMGVEILSGKQLTPAQREELLRPMTDFGSRELEQLGPRSYGVVVRMPAGQSGEANLYAAILDSQTFFRGRALVEVEAGADLTLIENLSSQGKENLYATSTRVKVQKNGTLHYVLVQDTPLNARSFNFLEIEAHESAQVHVTLLNLGGEYIRQEVTALLKGTHASVNLHSLSLANGAQEIDQRTLQIHEAPDAKSDLLFKNILDDKARTVFSGLIRVAPGAQKTDAYQKNRNLMLSEEAQANSLPGLEIEANDVRCTHGATCGRLSAEELFYLRSRGVPQREAKRMLVGGFAEEILATLPEEVAHWTREKIEARLK